MVCSSACMALLVVWVLELELGSELKTRVAEAGTGPSGPGNCDFRVGVEIVGRDFRDYCVLENRRVACSRRGRRPW